MYQYNNNKVINTKLICILYSYLIILILLYIMIYILYYNTYISLLHKIFIYKYRECIMALILGT